MPSCQAFNCTNEKGKCEENVFAITDPTLFNTSTTVRKEHGQVRQHLKVKKNTLAWIKRAKKTVN